jgi:hypothetical protein
MTYDEHDAADNSDHWLDLGRPVGKPALGMKKMKFSLGQFPNRMRQPNSSAFNRWKNVWVVRYREIKHQSIIQGPN